MTSLTNISSNSESVFNSIKHVDGNGIEFWYARELMPTLGYISWQKFQGVISKAQFACQNTGASIDEHFEFLPEAIRISTSGRGRLGDDFKLTRYACYLTAMNGDPRKPEIAAAQSYFAVKTHEAETIIPVQSESLMLAQLRIKEIELQNSALEKQNAILEKELMLRQLDNTMLTLHGAPTVLALRGCQDQVIEVEKPTLEVIDQKSGARFKGMTTADMVKYISRKNGIKYKSGADVKRFLESSGNAHLLAQTPRRVLADYIPEENIEEAIKILTSGNRQLLLGETSAD